MRLAAAIIGFVLLCGWSPELPAQGMSSASPTGERAGSLTLTPPSAKSHSEAGKPVPAQSPITLVISLAAVLGIFFVVAWLLRRSMPRGHGLLPPEVFAVLGRAPLANRNQVQLVRCGNKLLLVSIGTNGAETLSEITDPLEVPRLVELCSGNRNGAAANEALRQREVGNA